VNGVTVSNGWTLGDGGMVTFTTPPASGAVVRAGFLFDVPVRFEQDRLDVRAPPSTPGKPQRAGHRNQGGGMSRVWFAQDLETVATWWRIDRCDGVSLGFSAHDADLWFDGLTFRAAPGMMPASIRRSSGFDADSAEVDGAITHETISEDDLVAGRYDGARVVVGLVDWDSLEFAAIYSGTIGTITEEAGSFSAQLLSRKADLARDPCRAPAPVAGRISAGRDAVCRLRALPMKPCSLRRTVPTMQLSSVAMRRWSN
jgi:hypothetical protein